MLLKALTPSNFGPFFKQQRIEFEDDVTVLTGANDVGKSAVLRLIAQMLNDPQEGSLCEADVNQDHLQKLRGAWDVDTSVGCAAEFLITERTRHFLPNIAFAEGTLKLRCRLAPKVAERVIETHSLKSGGVQSLNSHIGDLPRSIYLPRKPEATISDVISLTKPQLIERELLGVAFGSDFEPEAIAKLSDAKFHQLLKRGEQKLTDAIQPFLPGDMRLGFVMSAYGNERTKIAMALTDKHRGYVPPSIRGAGLRRLLTVLGALLLQLRASGQFIVLYDEPETSLHADAQHYLRTLLEAIAAKPNAQVIYATHSPSMINTLKPSSLRVLARSNHEDTACTLVDNKPFGKNLYTVRTSLGLTPSDSLLYAPICLVVEGRTEVASVIPLLQRLFSESVEGFHQVPELLEFCHIIDGQGDNLDSICELAKSQGSYPVIFVDGDKVRRLQSLQRANKLVGIPFAALPNNTEFEQIVPRATYLSAAGAEAGIDGEADALFHEFERTAAMPAQMLFSKRVEIWLSQASPDYIFDKPRVMKRALQNTPSEQIQVDVLRPLVKLLEGALSAIQRNHHMRR